MNSGCGLLHIPYSEVFPDEPMQRIYVLDLKDHAPITDATVTCTLTKWDNWFPPHAFWGIQPEESSAKPGQSRIQKPDSSTTWPAEQLGNGVYQFKPISKWATKQIWFPLPPVLGSILYHTHLATIQVSAPRYKTVWVNNGIEKNKNQIGESYRSDNNELPSVNCVEVGSNSVKILLPRQAR